MDRFASVTVCIYFHLKKSKKNIIFFFNQIYLSTCGSWLGISRQHLTWHVNIV